MVRLEDGVRRIDFMRWGLIPIWVKDAKIGVQCVNARSETVQEKPAFRDAFEKRCCIVPADGWVEWTDVSSKSNPGSLSCHNRSRKRVTLSETAPPSTR